MRAVAVRDPLAGRLHTKCFRVFLGEPRGRSRSGSAQNDHDVMLLREANRVIQPIEVKAAFRGLHAAPGKLCNAHNLQVGGFHHLEVCFPACLGPLLGVPVGSDEQGIATRELRGDRVLRGRSGGPWGRDER